MVQLIILRNVEYLLYDKWFVLTFTTMYAYNMFICVFIYMSLGFRFSPLFTYTKITILIQKSCVQGFCNCGMGYFKHIFVDAEITHLLNGIQGK